MVLIICWFLTGRQNVKVSLYFLISLIGMLSLGDFLVALYVFLKHFTGFKTFGFPIFIVKYWKLSRRFFDLVSLVGAWKYWKLTSQLVQNVHFLENLPTAYGNVYGDFFYLVNTFTEENVQICFIKLASEKILTFDFSPRLGYFLLNNRKKLFWVDNSV